ncbi:DUF7289 family protein [Salinirubrum litoreum]|uniref:Flagellin n=1 Tax=Salinirubrum litoreum TaxID=1126234 RepID=A0ABD5RE21_9EURY|nr:hypothetical protein [Salinirubrum litoreum]
MSRSEGSHDRPSPVPGSEAARTEAGRAASDGWARFGVDERAVSDTLGYAITLGMILSMITFLYVSGVGTFGDLKSDARAVNADRAFEILDDNVRDVYARGAPSRAIELKLSDAQLSVVGNTEFEVTVTDPAGPTTNYPLSFVPIEYETGQTTMSYENGAVFRRNDGGGAVMDSRPPFVFTDDRTVMTSVVTRGSASVGGDGAVLIVAERTESQLLTDVDEAGGTPVTVQFDIESPNAPAWQRYLESSLPSGYTTIDGDPSDDTLAYSFETDRFVLRQTKLAVSLE